MLEPKIMTGPPVVTICLYGGEFITDNDGSISYSGGEAHALEVDRDMQFEDFKLELSSMFNFDVSGMSFKYFLPNNKRTPITISSDKDLNRMVDFNSNALTMEVYIVNKVDNRITGSTIADSGTSIVATAVAVGSDRQRRVTRARANLADSANLVTANNLIGQDNTSTKQKRLAENMDCRSMVAGFGISGAALPYDIENARQGIAIADKVDTRDSESVLFDPSIPTTASLATPEDSRPLHLNSPWANVISGVGQEFDNVKDFRDHLCKYAISKGFVYKFVKNETSRVTVKCSDGSCPWRLHASESSRSKKFVIKKLNDVHTCCGGNGKDSQRRATRQWLTNIIKEKLHESPQCKPKELVKELYEDFGVNLSYSQVWRGREVAQKELYNTLEETYNQLPWFCEKILETNPGSVAILSTSLDSKFRRFFIAFHASLHGFEHGCRPLLFLDRIPLKTTNQFKLLVVASVDGDDAIFPVAFAVVEDENYDSWLWFLSQLKYAITTSCPITFVSNRHKGLEEVVPQLFKDSHHCYCLHHLIEDFKGELRNGSWTQQLKDAMITDFTRAAQASTVEEFNACIESIRSISTEAAEWVMGTKPEHWSDSMFAGSRYDHLSLNIMDSLNNWIPVKQESSIIQIIDAICDKLMGLMEGQREIGNDWVGILTPSIEQKLQKEASKACKLSVICSTDTIFEVRSNTIFIVNIGNWECTCKRWQISSLPCMHAIAVFDRLGKSVYEYCSRYFRIDCYRLTYSASIYPISELEGLNFSQANSYPPPPTQRPLGRPRRKRFNPNKIATVVRLCSRCKVAGHNKATCEAIL